MAIKPGWYYLANVATKFHYFDESGRSLCRKYGLLPRQGDPDGQELLDHYDNCKACNRKRKAMLKGAPTDADASTTVLLSEAVCHSQHEG